MNDIPSGPTAMAQHLAKYITDDSAVKAYVDSYYSQGITRKRVAQIRKELPRNKPVGRQDVPFTAERPLATSRKGCVDPLAHAIWRFGAAGGYVPNMTREQCKARL